MKILQLTHKPPFPVKDGGCLAINQFSDTLVSQGIDLHVFSISTPKHPFKKDAFPKGYIAKNHFQSVFVDTSVNVVDAFVNLITRDTYHVSRFFSPDVDMELHKLLASENFDVVLCESIFVAPYIGTIRKMTKARVVLRSHNLEFSIWHRLAKSHKMGVRKTYLKILTRQLRNYEVEILNQIDGLIAINPDELLHYQRLGYKGKSMTFPFAINTAEYVPDPKPEEVNSIFHLGSMDWKPNVEGVQWFLREVWPKVRRSNKSLTLYLAGRRMPEELISLKADGVDVVGEVPDAQDFMKSKNIMIVPLKTGAGMRVKIIEALALKKPIVATPIGANGIAVRHGESAYIAHSARDFADCILKLAADPTSAVKMGEKGRKLIEDQYNQCLLSERLSAFFKEITA
ncbi:MAG TPA: glycosyltransferase family 4 protein [Cryomorphaceae bacterium]|nr:glycosyltransferase family 4 protein [Cryomorphaceae bacterium]